MSRAPGDGGITMRRRYHIHFSGILFTGVTLFLGIGAINSQNNLLFLVFGLCLGAVLVSGILSGAMMMGLRLHRLAVSDGVVGVPLRIAYSVRSNSKLLAAYAILIRERHHAEPVPITPPISTCIVKVGPGERIRCSALVTPLRRGRLILSRVEASSSFPFGIFRKSVSIDQSAEVLILPRLRPVRDAVFESLAARRLQHGLASSSKRGMGDDFWGLREYAPGDSARLIAWRAAARTGELVVRQHTDAPIARLRVILLFSPARSDQDHERIIEAGASVIAAGIDRDIACMLTVPQANLNTPTGLTPAHRHALIRALAELDSGTTLAQREASLHLENDAAQIILTNGAPPLGALRARIITIDQLDQLIFAPTTEHAP